ncbi:MAG: M48 family metallopeptidase, partial [Deltaproteobacteria bacterium]|nr:M48 family metallopeptidase [Deltaproteobacteria bacterium]
SFQFGPIPTGLIFAGVLLLAFQMISIPFSIYNTFVIEEKYGFNRTTVRTFTLDILKSWLLAAVLGGVVFSIVLWLFNKAGDWAWAYCWVVVVLFQVGLVFVAPVVILPLFNKFYPLEDGELKTAIEKYAKSQDFKMKGVFRMDASKRSTKSNAFFTSFGRFRRIVLFDTLIKRHTLDELVSVLAHETGHYKKKHILKSILMSIITTQPSKCKIFQYMPAYSSLHSSMHPSTWYSRSSVTSSQENMNMKPMHMRFRHMENQNP